MSKLLRGLSFSCLLVATAAAQPPMPKPGPEQKRLEAFVDAEESMSSATTR
jgi:hypothetical protein